MFKRMTICLDMAGCPNRCKHCWIGHSPNASLTEMNLQDVAEQFKPYANQMTIYSWLREPDYHKAYQRLWELENELSHNATPERFELLSFYRIVRDPEYLNWAYEQGVRTCQLTFFGLEEMTDQYVGRKGAFLELLKATDMVLESKIAPRWQVFVNKENLAELETIIMLSESLRLKERCQEFGGIFELFVHQGSCDGENEKRITDEDLLKIPTSTLKFDLGQPESYWVEKFSEDDSTRSFMSEEPTFFVSSSFEVYPNISAMSSWWSLGNLKQDGIEMILKRYVDEKSLAQRVSTTVSLKELVKACGDVSSRRLFDEEDYIHYLINQYCKKLG